MSIAIWIGLYLLGSALFWLGFAIGDQRPRTLGDYAPCFGDAVVFAFIWPLGVLRKHWKGLPD